MPRAESTAAVAAAAFAPAAVAAAVLSLPRRITLSAILRACNPEVKMASASSAAVRGPLRPSFSARWLR